MLHLLSALAAAYQEEGGGAGGAVGALVGLVFLVVWLAFVLAIVAGIWKVFVKAGEPGWAALVPIYNLVVLVKVSGKPMWWLVLFLIPLANFVALIMIAIAVAERFGKGAGYGLGLALLPFIFYPMLGFSDAQYRRA